MHYVTSDIHNDSRRFRALLREIHFTKRDKLYILGDLFDRSFHEPDPVGVYFSILELGDACVVMRGNHDEWLASYLWDYCHRTERERAQTALPWERWEDDYYLLGGGTGRRLGRERNRRLSFRVRA